MWQLQWAWSLIPSGVLYWIINLIIVLGLIGVLANTIGRFIPVVNNYVRFARPIGIALLVVGVWMRGGYDTEQAWRARVADLERAVAESEAKSKSANDQLSSAIRDKNRAIKDAQAQTQNRIAESAKQMDAECRVDPEAISILNDSAKNAKGKK